MKTKSIQNPTRILFLILLSFISFAGNSIIYLNIPNPVNCGNVKVCSQSTINLYIVSTMSSTQDFTGTLQHGTIGSFTLNCVSTTCCPNCNFNLPPNTNCLIAQITFAPTFTGGQSTAFIITNHPDCYVNGGFYPASQNILINVTGNGIDPTMIMTVSPATPDYIGTCHPFYSLTGNITIQNSSSSSCPLELTIHNEDLTAPFKMIQGGGDYTLNPGDPPLTLTVRFYPTSIGSFQSYFRIENNSTNYSNTLYYYVNATATSPQNPNNWDLVLVNEYPGPDLKYRIYLLGKEGSDYIIKKAIPSLNSSLTFSQECGGAIIADYLYVADQNNNRVLKINLNDESYSTLLTNVSLPHDIQYIQGDSIYILTQSNSVGGGVNSLIRYNISNDQYSSVLLNNQIGSPTRLVNIKDTLYISYYNSDGSRIYWCLKSALNDGILDISERTLLKQTYSQDRSLIVSRKSSDSLMVLSFTNQTPYKDTLYIYRSLSKLNYCEIIPTKYSPYVCSYDYPNEDNKAFLVSDAKLSTFNYQSTNGTLSEVFSTLGGSYMFYTPITIQIGDIGNYNVTSYVICNKNKATVEWNAGSLPSSIQMNYYPGVYPVQSSKLNTAKEFWEIECNSGSDYTYNLTIYYDEKYMYSFNNTLNLMIVKRENSGEWIPLPNATNNPGLKKITINGLTDFSAMTQFTLIDGPILKSWTGMIDDDWNKNGNWNPTYLPTQFDDVIIPATALHMPVVNINGLGCNNLTIQEGAIMTISPGYQFIVHGITIIQ